MKVMSYICEVGETHEKREWLLSMGVNVFRQHSIGDTKSSRSYSRFIFVIPNKEVETFIKLKVPKGTFEDCSS